MGCLQGAFPVKILQVYKDVFPEVAGGIERYVHDFSLFLTARGHQVEILVAGGGDRTVGGVPVHGVPELCRILSNPLVPGFSRYLKSTGADAVHFHLPLPSAVLGWLGIPRDNRKPWVVTYHSDIVRQAFAMPFYAPFLTGFLKGAFQVLATSENYLRTSPYLKGLTNASVVPIGVDPARFTPAMNPSRDFFLFVGRFRKYKGIQTLLHAWRMLEDPPRLIMAGGGKMEKEVKEFSIKHHLPVTIKSNVSDMELNDLYGNARALILPSTQRSEAYGMVQLEAMACGTPVISSDLPTGVSWVNRNGETGLLFSTGNPETLAEAVRKLNSDDVFMDSAGKAARKRALMCFDSSVLFGKVEECLLRAAGN